MGFPKDFIWGAATASAQIEGGWDADGRGPSVWDYVRPEEERSPNGADARITCGHYDRWREDVKLMKEIGLKSYRFSISWSRLFPEGFGPLNEKGAAFYSRLIDALLEAGIKPMITIFHWDLPEGVYRRGGWLNPDCGKWFADYAAKVVELYSDRVDTFLTFNEPECFIDCAYNNGTHAPFARLPFDRVLQLAHGALLANGLATRAMRAAAKRPIKIGMAVASSMCVPATESDEDIEAARYASFNRKGRSMFKTIAFAETALKGRYPDCIEKEYGTWFDHSGADMEIIHAPFDIFALNIYQSAVVSAGDGEIKYNLHSYNTPYTTMGWPVTPNCIYWASKFIYERYKLPIHITENGVATVDIPDSNGKIDDGSRIAYIKAHLKGVERALDEGIPIKSYYYWSLLDNFEWGKGFTQRFGLYYVDYNTLERIPKRSAGWYRELIASNGEILHK